MKEESADKFSFPAFEYLIDELLPTQEIHLIGGPTGAGKTTWLLRLLDQWRKGESVFGHASHPTDFIYISLDRSYNGMLRIFQRLHLDPRPFKLIFPTLTDRKLGVPLMLKKFAAQNPTARLVVVEGFQTGVENINDQREVTSYLAEIQALCVNLNLTVIGVVHTSKAKQNAKYENPRERIAGCMQWGGWSETIVMIEPHTDALGIESEVRTLQILPRNGRSLVFQMEFKDGLLVEQAKVLTNEQKILAYCANRPDAAFHRKADFRAVTGMPEASLERLIENLIKTGRLARIEDGKGTYKYIPQTQASN